MQRAQDLANVTSYREWVLFGYLVCPDELLRVTSIDIALVHYVAILFSLFFSITFILTIYIIMSSILFWLHCTFHTFEAGDGPPFLANGTSCLFLILMSGCAEGKLSPYTIQG